MQILDDDLGLQAYLEGTQEIGEAQPLLIDRYLSGLEIEVDAVSNGQDVIIPAVMEHVERAGCIRETRWPCCLLCERRNWL